MYITNNNSAPGSHYIRGNSTHIVHGTANGNIFYLNYGNSSGSVRQYGAVYQDNSLVGNLWGSSNDGSGSGLDADLLDGQQGSYYLNYDNLSNKPTNIDNADTVDSLHASSFLRSDASDTYTSGTFTFGSGTALDLATNDVYAALRVIRNNGGITDGMYIGYGNSGTGSTRIFGGGSTTGGIRVNGSGNNDIKMGTSSGTAWHSANDGSGSGLDADTLDGINSSSFLRSDADDTTTGHLTFSDSGYSIGSGYHVWKRSYVVNSSNPQELLYEDGNSLPNGGSYRFHAHISGTGTDQSATAVYWNQNGTWKLNVTYQSGTSSNHPEFIISNSVPTIHIDHASNYTIHVLGERLELNEGTGTDNKSGFGTDAYFSVNDTTLRFNPSGSGAINTGNLVWHAGNDGSGSGLDADTLDGYNTLENGANVVLRSNGSGYLNIRNWINVAGTGFYSDTYGNHFHVENNGYIARSGSTTASQIRFQTNDGPTTRGYVYANSSNYIGFLDNGASWLFQARSNGQLYQGNGNGLIWHAANDGSGSSLDSDLLDGQHGSYYLNYNNFSNTPSIPSVGNGTLTINTSGSVSGSGTFTANQSGNSTITITGSGIMQGTNAFGNASFSNAIGEGFRFQRVTGGSNRATTSHHNVLQIPNTSGDIYLAQMAFGTDSSATKLAWRSKGTSFGSWYDIWHSGNDGSGSGLDADTVDGQHASAFLTSESDTLASVTGRGASTSTKSTFSGGASIAGTNHTRSIPTKWYGTAYTNTDIDYYEHNHAKAQLGNTYKYTTSRPVLTSDTNYWVGSMGWGNTDLNTVFSWGSGFWDSWSSPNNSPSGTSHWQGINALHYSANTGNTQYGMQMTMGAGNTNLMYVRGIWGGGFGSWQKMWNAGNDGSGSGLDADLLDGQQGSYYAPASTVPTVHNGTLTITTSGSASGSGSFTANSSANTTINISATDTTANETITLSGSVSGSGTTSITTRFPITQWLNSTDGKGRFYFADSSTTYYKSWSGDHRFRNQSDADIALINSTNIYKMSGSTAYGVWHSANDGSGSGLDADTLDGVELANIARTDIHETFTSNLTVNNNLYIGDNNDGYFFNDTNGRTAFAGGDFYIQSSVTTYYNYATYQYIGDSSGDNIYFRGNVLSGTGWGIDGAGKLNTRDHQINAGYHLQRSDHHSGHLEGSYNNVASNGSKTNPIYTIGSSYNPNDDTLGNMYGVGFASSAYASYLSFTGASNWGFYVAADGDARVFLDGSSGVVTSTGQHYVGSNVVWNAGNDGAGSGLDADTLDGLQASSFVSTHNGSNRTIQAEVGALHFYGDGVNSGNSNYSYAIFQEAGAWSHPYPDLVIAYHTGIKIGGHTSYGGTRFYDNNPTSGQIIASIGDGDNHFRGYHNGFLRHGGSTDHKLITTGNDGSGSGLDADLLDGQQGSYYAPASSIGNGTITINAGSNMSGGGTFTVNQSGNTTITLNSTASGGGGSSGSQTVTARVKANRLDYISATSPATIYTATSGKVIVLEEAICFIDADAVSATGYPSFGYPIRVRLRSQWNSSHNSYVHNDGGMTFTKEALNSLFRSNSQSANYSANMKRFIVAQPRDPTANNPDQQQQIAEVVSSDGTFNTKIQISMDSYVSSGTSEDYYFYFQVRFREITLTDITSASGMITI